LLNRSFPDIVEALSQVQGRFVWGAELTVDEHNGRSSFERLQRRAVTSLRYRVAAAAREDPARLYVFDMLSDDGSDIRHLPLEERKDVLRASFENTSRVIYVTGIVGAGVWVFSQVQALDLEGMIAKWASAGVDHGVVQYHACA
jgi:bifunctional non-homologous end joining protein LigD